MVRFRTTQRLLSQGPFVERAPPKDGVRPFVSRASHAQKGLTLVLTPRLGLAAPPKDGVRPFVSRASHAQKGLTLVSTLVSALIVTPS